MPPRAARILAGGVMVAGIVGMIVFAVATYRGHFWAVVGVPASATAAALWSALILERWGDR